MFYAWLIIFKKSTCDNETWLNIFLSHREEGSGHVQKLQCLFEQYTESTRAKTEFTLIVMVILWLF